MKSKKQETKKEITENFTPAGCKEQRATVGIKNKS